MKITCDSCGAKYTIADDKVRGRKVKIRCKGCGTPIVVDGQQPGGPASVAPASVPAGELRSAEGDTGIPIESAPASARGAAGGDWSVNLSETDQRTLSTQQIVEGWKSGTITADAFVWRDGMGDWTAILESTELAPLLKAGGEAPAQAARAAGGGRSVPAQPARGQGSPAQTARSQAAPAGGSRAPAAPVQGLPAQARPQAGPARISGGRAQVGMDLFAGVETAGADDEEIATSAPILPHGGPPAASAEDPRLTGARNENSVLFSLDALKAGFAGPKAEPQKKAASRPGARPAKADDPFGMGAAGMGGVSAAPPMFSLSDNQALLTAPAPPPEPPPKPVQVFVPGAAPAPERKGPAKLIAMVLGGLLVVGGAAAYVSASSGGEEERIAKASAAAAAEADRKAREEEKQKREDLEKEIAAKAVEREKAQAQNAPSAPPAPEETAKGGASGTSGSSAAVAPGGSKRDAPSSTAKRDDKKEEKKEEEPKAAAAAGGEAFSKSSAVSALGAAAGQASSCKKLGGPTGSGKVTVTFANSGRVTSANVNGPPFAGTSVGGCVASIFRKAKVPPFSGSTVTVSKGFSIN